MISTQPDSFATSTRARAGIHDLDQPGKDLADVEFPVGAERYPFTTARERHVGDGTASEIDDVQHVAELIRDVKLRAVRRHGHALRPSAQDEGAEHGHRDLVDLQYTAAVARRDVDERVVEIQQMVRRRRKVQ